jgi:selenocysteine lyase/cysteine desulfurase
MATGESAFEDGTLNFLSIPDVAVGLDWLAGIGIDVINTRVRCLTGWFLDRLVELRHSNSSPMVLTYGPTDTTMRGGNVVFNLLDVEGKVVDERLVARESAAARISLRTGCFCNPGCGEDAFGLNLMRLRPLMWAHKKSNLDTYISLIGLPSAGAIRVSFGVASAPKDIDRVLSWIEATYRDRITNADGLPLRERC